MKVKIWWRSKTSLFDEQEKQFKDITSLAHWVHKNHKNIIGINGKLTPAPWLFEEKIDIFDVIRVCETCLVSQ